jgi:site-specific DNA recombinase
MMIRRRDQNGNKLAIVYCRVSTKGQRDGTSLQTQAEACIKHAESLGYTVGRVTKEVFSGAELWDRPQLSRDRAELKSGMFHALFCYSTDRLARDPIHLCIIAQECERDGVVMSFVTEPLDNSPEGMLIRYVKGYAAAIEREKIKERMMRGRKAKLRSGKPTFVGDGLFGYRPDREAGKYVIYEPEARIVRRVFEMCLAGYGASSIAKRFNAEGISSPKSAKSTWQGKSHWCQATTYNILKNPAYKGEEFGWRTKRLKGRDKPRPRSEWIRLPDDIRPAIVSAITWQAAQDTFKTTKGATRRNERKPVLLRGNLFCSGCGRAMHLREYARYRKGRDMYRCNSTAKLWETGCDGQNVPFKEMNEWIWGEIKTILSDPSIIETELRKLENMEPDSQTSHDLEATKRELAKVERGLQALMRRFRDASDDQTLWPYIEREIAQAAREKEHLEATIADFELRLAKRATFVDEMHSIRDYCGQVAGRLEEFTFEEKRLSFTALGLKVFASGRDKEQWRYEISIPASDQGEPCSIPEPLNPVEQPSSQIEGQEWGRVGGQIGGQFRPMNEDSFGRRADREARLDHDSAVSLAASHDLGRGLDWRRRPASTGRGFACA